MRFSQRLLLCRWGFVLFCLLPTIVVAGWIARRSSGGYRAAERQQWERAIADQLGLGVQIADLSHPDLQATLLKGVRLVDPESGAVIAESSAVEVIRDDSGWQIEAAQPMVMSAALADVGELLHDRLLRAAGSGVPAARFGTRELTISTSTSRQTLTNFRGELEESETGAVLSLAFHLPAASTGQPVQLTIARHRTQLPAVTWWQLDTSGQALPLSLVDGLLPELAALGSGCQFAGRLTAAHPSAGWTGQLGGILSGVDLDRLVSERFTHQLSGAAALEIERATLHGGQLVELRGVLHSSGGAISPSLIAAAQEHLGLARAADNPTLRTAALVPFTRLAVRFDLNDQSLVLRSGDHGDAGPLLLNAAGPILEAPPAHKTAAVSLLRTLLPDNRHQVPATHQTQALVRLLPVPPIEPHDPAARTAHTPTRLAPAAPDSNGPPLRQPIVR